MEQLGDWTYLYVTRLASPLSVCVRACSDFADGGQEWTYCE